MKRNLLLLSCCCAFTFYDVLSASPSCLPTKDGVIVFTNPACTGTSNTVTLEMISDNIISVNTVPGKEMAPAQSLVTGYTQRPDFSWKKTLFPSFPYYIIRPQKQLLLSIGKAGISVCCKIERFELISSNTIKQSDWIWTLMTKRYV